MRAVNVVCCSAMQCLWTNERACLSLNAAVHYCWSILVWDGNGNGNGCGCGCDGLIFSGYQLVSQGKAGHLHQGVLAGDDVDTVVDLDVDLGQH